MADCETNPEIGSFASFGPSTAVDPNLAALFAESTGPVSAPSNLSRYAKSQPNAHAQAEDASSKEPYGSLEDLPVSGVREADLSDVSSLDKVDLANKGSQEDRSTRDQQSKISGFVGQHRDGKRRRKQRDDVDDLEARHLQRLTGTEETEGKGENARKRHKKGPTANGDQLRASIDQVNDGDDGQDAMPIHESLATDGAESALEQAARTAFLSNVSSEAISSKSSKKALLAHLSSALDTSASPPQRIISIRFRSTAYSSSAIPKRAAFAMKTVMDATTKSTNAYVVFSTASAMRVAVSKLNGTVVLGRHLRVDSVAHPAAVDHQRCVFVGNLGFVDDETVLDVDQDEEGKDVERKRKRTKQPMDVEEGLWRVFGKEAGQVESVRVVRDSATRVGKGFAYVQFQDGTSVEAALLLAGKKFPPMLPRALRVSRCKAPHKTARAMEAKLGRKVAPSKTDRRSRRGVNDYVAKPTSESRTLAGRAEKMLGRAGAAMTNRSRGSRPASSRPARQDAKESTGPKTMKSPEEIVFEGRRASARDGKPKDLKFKTKKAPGKGPRQKRTGRAGARAAKWRAEASRK